MRAYLVLQEREHAADGRHVTQQPSNLRSPPLALDPSADTPRVCDGPVLQLGKYAARECPVTLRASNPPLPRSRWLQWLTPRVRVMVPCCSWANMQYMIVV